MKKKANLFHHSACIFLLLFTLIILRPDMAACAAPTLSWTDSEGLWNDGVTPDYGIVSSDDFTFKVIYTDSDNDAPYTGYPKVHILQGGTDISGSPFTMTQETGCGLPYCGNGYTDGEQYYYTTTLTSAGNYTYYFEAKDSNEDIAGFSSSTNEHTLTVVSGYVWVDYDTGSNYGPCGPVGDPCQTIAYGISKASSGQAVRVMAGSYTESFTMASGVHVVSDNSGNGDSEAVYDDPYSDYETSILTRSGRVTITGLITFTDDVTLDGITLHKNTGDKALDITGGSPVIKNCIVRRDTPAGSRIGKSCIEMDNSAPPYTEPVIENNLLHYVNLRGIGVSSYTSPIIQDNEIWDTGAQGIGLNRKGTPGGEVAILNNLIFNNDGVGIGNQKISSDDTYQMKIVIQGNTIHDNGIDRAGIGLRRTVASGGGGPTLEIVIGGSDPSQGNTIYNNGMAGIMLDGNDLGFNPVLIQNNTLYNNDKTGINLIDVGLSGDIASILDNTIYGQTKSGINIGEDTYADIMYNSIYENYAGIGFQASSDPVNVNIEDNDIYSNTMAGITVINAITGDATIAGNEIHENYRAGIVIRNSCENLVINRNEIHDNFRSGIHTGGPYDLADDYFANSNDECTASGEPYPCCTGLGTGTCNSSVGFVGTTDSAFLDVSQNKVYGNGLNDIGGGIDIRHASGAIYNNLVYENAMGGIRYGNYIDEISNNTVVDNGIGMYGFGGGIIYDSLDGYVADIPFGDGPSIPIRNNISAFHPSAGIRTEESTGRGYVCLSDDYRDYNLLYGNNSTTTTVSPILFWPPWFYYPNTRPQLGGCSPNANEIFADPEFVDRDNDDYRLQVTSLAVDVGDTGYDLNTDCTDVGVPYTCCDGDGTGTCPTYDYGTDVSLPPGVGTTDIDMGAYGGQYPIDW